jgi:gentisate 1,2-dioxygenase
MTFFMMMLRPGEKTLPLRQTSNITVIPFEGRGQSVVADAKFDWAPFDTVAIPGGQWYEHRNLSDKDPAILFVASDEPVLKVLAFYRKHGKNAAGDIVRLA